MRSAVVLLGFVCTLGCTHSPQRVFEAKLDTAELEIYASALQCLFATHDAERRDGISFYALSIRGLDPPNEFLQRFAGHRPPVQGAGIWGSQDRIVLSGGLHLDLGPIERLSEDSAQLSGSFYEEPSSSARYRFAVRRVDRGWRAETSTMEATLDPRGVERPDTSLTL